MTNDNRNQVWNQPTPSFTAVGSEAQDRAENADLRTALQNTRIELVAAQNARADAERDLEAAHEDLATAAQSEARHQDAIAAWRRAWDVLEQERDAFADARSAYKDELAIARTEVENLKHGETLARRTIEGVLADHKRAVAMNADLRYDLARADARIAELLAHHDTHHAKPWWHLW